MGDLALRVSLLVQRGLACEQCGSEIDGQMTGTPRSCRACLGRATDDTSTAPSPLIDHSSPSKASDRHSHDREFDA